MSFLGFLREILLIDMLRRWLSRKPREHAGHVRPAASEALSHAALEEDPPETAGTVAPAGPGRSAANYPPAAVVDPAPGYSDYPDELQDRIDRLQDRIDELENRLLDCDVMSDRYDRIQEEIDRLQDRLDELEDSFDPDAADFDDDPLVDYYDDADDFFDDPYAAEPDGDYYYDFTDAPD